MKFVKKYGVALLVTVLLVISIVWIGTDWVESALDTHYYNRWVIDDSNLLSNDAISELALHNEGLDDSYGSIVGLVTTQSLDGNNIVDYSYSLFHNYSFGDNDLMILLALDENLFYVADGDAMAGNFPNTLRIALQEQFSGKPLSEETVLNMYDVVVHWYESNVPQNSADSHNRNRSLRGMDVILFLICFLAAGFVLLLLFRYLVWPLFRYNSLGAWKPLWGWGLFGPVSIKRKKT